MEHLQFGIDDLIDYFCHLGNTPVLYGAGTSSNLNLLENREGIYCESWVMPRRKDNILRFNTRLTGGRVWLNLFWTAQKYNTMQHTQQHNKYNTNADKLSIVPKGFVKLLRFSTLYQMQPNFSILQKKKAQHR